MRQLLHKPVGNVIHSSIPVLLQIKITVQRLKLVTVLLKAMRSQASC